MKKFLFICLFLVAVASLGSANKLPNVTVPALPPSIPTENPIELIGELSPQCQAAFLSVVANPEFFQCVPVAALLPVLTDPTFIPSIIQDPIKNGAKLLPIFDAICADPKCSDKGVATALKAIETGCAADLANPLVQLAIGVLTFYSPARDIICFKDNKDEYCLVESITNILSLPPPPIKLLGGVIDSVAFAEPKFVCTPCNKAIVNTLIIFFGKHPEAVQILELGFHIGEEELVLAKFGVAIKCGSPFVDGKVGDPTTPPDKFEYQEAGNSTKSDASKLNGLGVMMISSLVATALILN